MAFIRCNYLHLIITIPISLMAEGCQATVAHDHLVRELLQRMEKSVKPDEPPNPSILLAMNLAGATQGHVHRWLLQEIKKSAVERAQTVALYILALLSSCQDPRRVHALEQTLDLIPILKHKMTEEISNNGTQGHERRTGGTGGVSPSLHPISSPLLDPTDTQAMAVLALVCAYNHTDGQDLIHDALKAVTNYFLDEQKGHGIIGDIYSMGLALQALETSGEFYAPRKWDRAQAFSVVYAHDYQQPMAMAQVLPALVGRSYLDECPRANSSRLQHSGDIRAAITVQFSITNTLKNYFHYSTWVCVPDNSTLLDVMQVARNEKPDIFCFKIKWTHLGPFVTSIHGLAGNKTERTYWQFFSCWSPLQEGVGTYKPKNWEHTQAVFSTY
uniref:Gastric intrinsic factor n=1 Tax=Cyanoderma ruficeps TaxID=181631 RepID=A0A8C3NQQ9_9PASS